MEQIRIVKEMRAADVERGRTARFIRPRFMAWENVPGAFSSGSPKGEDFRIVLEEICKISGYPVHVPRPHAGPWQFAGRIRVGDSFSLAWRVMDAQHWGLAQRRARIFLISDFGGLTAPKILFEPESLPGYPAPGPGTGQAPATPSGGGAEGPGGADGVCHAHPRHRPGNSVCGNPE
ncbi:DNA cytosine methyltransferase [uncultured Oscillibacter sp.]|uniref:DNA cytosine methyltransferase n=1 Tax=uncultured Oscillibacter sp. TaxID=876091 RepID=UPI00345DA82D